MSNLLILKQITENIKFPTQQLRLVTNSLTTADAQSVLGLLERVTSPQTWTSLLDRPDNDHW